MNTPTCTPETAAKLYARLEYYREYMPSILDMTEAQYAATTEAKFTDEALVAYINETGVTPTYPLK